MSILEITAANREEAMQEALRRLELPQEALDFNWSEEKDDLLAGARPWVQLSVSIRLEYVAGKVMDHLRALLEKMQIECMVTSECVDDMILIKIETGDPEVLIGYRGETLDALQQLVLRIARLNGRDMPLVLIDAGEYRAKRIARLRRVASDLAKIVVETGQEEYFDPMDAIDRKIVHNILKNFRGIKTYSRGEDRNRHVIVAPED